MTLKTSLLLSLCLLASPLFAEPLVDAARDQVGVTLGYDPSYRALDYPMGDVNPATGVCSDVIIRAYRVQNMDLQQRVHEDMRAHFSAYPKLWGLKSTDKNIDHRRVPNLETFFTRHGKVLSISDDPKDYQAGDLVTWRLPGNLPHIGIVSDRRLEDGTPLIIHNIGRGAREDNILFLYPIHGHFRYPADGG